MSLLDNLCRLCANELNRSKSRNIFDPEQSDMLSTILRCIPISVEKDDRYPKFVCRNCAFKLDVLLEMTDRSLSSVKVFNQILASEGEKPFIIESLQVKQEKSIHIELSGNSELKYTVELGQRKEIKQEEETDDEVLHSIEENKMPIIPHVCNTCGSCFSRKSVLDLHLKKHIREDPPALISSQESIPEKNNVKPLTEKKFPCKFCKRSFSRQYHLTRHEEIHTGERRYKCRVCKKGFNHPSSLARHESLHNEENKSIVKEKERYPCNVCEKAFKVRAALLRHQLIHTGVRPYNCIFCEKSFSDQSTLTGHHLTHTGERPFQCKLCGDKFSKISTRNKHQRRHEGKKPFHCNICGRNYTEKATLANHRKNMHGT